MAEPLQLPDPAPRRRGLAIVEALAVFIAGVVVMHWLYAASAARVGDELGAPEHDSYYHVAMASMLPEHGLLKTFPWLRFCYFRDAGNEFVSHHWGFHVLLLPFVKLGEWWAGDGLAGGRWAMCAVFGANLMLFHLLLRQRRVPLHWLWIALFLLLPDQFLARHGYIRAIGASFLFMQLLLLALFARRYGWAALVLALYVHLYLGAVIFGPLIVVVFAVCQALGPAGERHLPWRMALLTAAGWAAGVLTYPYAGGMYEFLKLQVVGSGLSPEVRVGNEWFPYTDALFLVKMAAVVLLTWAIALLVRLRSGPRLDAAETTLVVLNFLFLLLTVKSKRFIEYWPPVCLLSAAYLLAPPLRAGGAAIRRWFERTSAGNRSMAAAATVLFLSGAAAISAVTLARTPEAEFLRADGQLWILLTLALALPALLRWHASEPRNAGRRSVADLRVPALGAILAAILWFALVAYPSSESASRIAVPKWAWIALATGYAALPALMSRTAGAYAAAAFPAWLSGIALLTTAVLLPTWTLTTGANTLRSAAQQLRCNYNLDEIRRLHAFLKQASQPGDTVFTDDWDIFPVFFYHNRHNHYIVGLDPEFTNQRHPDLWRRYEKISRGEVPNTIRLAASNGQQHARVDLTDIREHFNCRFVVADRDHRKLADALARRPELAEFVYPGGEYQKNRLSTEFVVFRIRDPGETPEPRAAAPSDPRFVFLSDLAPARAEQGWGELTVDRSVEGGTLRVAGKAYSCGLGTHAPGTLVYEIPPKARVFEAHVGIDDETLGRGSATVAVLLDGKRVFESAPLAGNDPPVAIRVDVSAAKRIELLIGSTSDGQRFDHVDWLDARFELDPDAEPR
jgi:NPCBM/NEW2 domain